MDGFTLSSPSIAPGGPIPRRHTCEGEDRSPELTWSGVPEGAASIAIVVDDPDAPRGAFVHWLAWGIDPGSGRLAEGAVPEHEGRNDFGRRGWRGPCPPRGHGPHRYVFAAHALDTPITVPRDADRATVEAAIEPHLLGTARLIGIYER
jgi:Raf kinase inhibitor-like protein, YbhB/YbcL family